jgi:hypothetical protein
MLIGAGLLVAASLLAFAVVRRPLRAEPDHTGAPQRVRIEECLHCPVTGPQVLPPPDRALGNH